MHRVLVVMGTRPEVNKLGPVVHALAASRPVLEPILCVTAQHREMLDQALRLFDLHPDHDLDVMREGQSLTFVTTAVLERVGALLAEIRPDVVLVQGDTTTAMATALAAFYERIPVGHVEAGLRTDDRYDPFPEEINRRLVGQLASLHFAPTRRAAARLRAEGVAEKDVYLTGNPAIDAVLWVRGRAKVPDLAPGRRLILVTAHRRENFGAPLASICRALARIVERNPDIEIVYPVHPNPNVVGPVHEALGGRERIHLVAPAGYDELIGYMDRSALVLTDSGGLQEEAPVLGKPVLVLRRTTERPEGVEAGVALLVGTDEERIVMETEQLLGDSVAYAAMARAQSPFGDGHAALRIAAILRQVFAGVGTGANEHRYHA